MPESAPRSQEPEARVIRVFVSSTFRDMVEEREQLAKHVFPALRKLCESRGVVWGEVDLRWGITAEQSERGEILPICLDEIHRCRPYFIGLLGERYGWVPNVIPPQLIEREPWLRGHANHSVTELEILHGVLNNPSMGGHAFFYFRDPDYLNRLHPGSNAADFISEDPASKTKLDELKDRIRESPFPTRENYPNPKILGEMVLQDMSAVINRLFPEGTKPDELDWETAEHEIFAGSRCVVEVRPGETVGVYIGRREYTDRLDAHANGEGPPLVVLGESGSGKTALLANWSRTYRATHTGDLVIQHYIGATPASTDWMAMLRRILGEFNRKFDLRLEIPDQPDALRVRFANALSMAAARGRVVLVLDGLDQMEDRNQAPDLVWLPPEIPSNIRLILTTLPGRPLDDLKKRGWPTMAVAPLEKDERRKLIVEYLRQYRKELDQPQVERIAAAPQSVNPLYLRALLEELRLWGNHKTLEDCIEDYLKAGTVGQLYEKILKRYEQDYEDSGHRGLVRNAMSLLWAARRGLTETEILELLGTRDNPLPRIFWSPLYLAAEMSLVSRSGLIGFFHDYFREAVRKLYLTSEEDCRKAHLRLAEYFHQLELTPRQVDELPWQLHEAEAWEHLGKLAANASFFDAWWDADQFQLKEYWVALAAKLAFDPIAEGTRIVATTGMMNTLNSVVSLLWDTGHREKAIEIEETVVADSRTLGNRQRLARHLAGLASMLHDTGRPDDAMVRRKEAEHLFRELGDRPGLASTLGNQAVDLLGQGDLKGAMAILEESEEIRKECGLMDDMSSCYGTRALIYRSWGDRATALKMLEEQERLCRAKGAFDELWYCLGNKAAVLVDLGKHDEAAAIYAQQEEVARRLGDLRMLSVALSNRAADLSRRGDLKESVALSEQVEPMLRKLGDSAVLAVCLQNIGVSLTKLNQLERAMERLNEAEQLCRQLGARAQLANCFCSKASVLSRGDARGALALLRDAEAIFRELDNKPNLAECLRNQGEVLEGVGELEQAARLFHDQEAIFQSLNDRRGVAQALNGQARLLTRQAKQAEAMTLFKKEESIRRELGDQQKLATCLMYQSDLLRQKGDLKLGLIALSEQEQIYRKCGDKSGLKVSLQLQALLLHGMGDFETAMGRLKENEQLCRELNDAEGLAQSLEHQNAIIQEMGATSRALASNPTSISPPQADPSAEAESNLAVEQAIALYNQTVEKNSQACVALADRIGELADKYKHAGITLVQAKALRNAAAGEQDSLRRERLADRISVLHDRYNIAEIAVEEAIVLFSATVGEVNPKRCEALADHIGTLLDRHNTAEIALQQAMALSNVTMAVCNSAIRERDTSRLEVLADRIEALYAQHQTVEIALCLAKALYNTTVVQMDSRRCEALADRISSLLDRHNIAEIAIELATALTNTIARTSMLQLPRRMRLAGRCGEVVVRYKLKRNGTRFVLDTPKTDSQGNPNRWP